VFLPLAILTRYSTLDHHPHRTPLIFISGKFLGGFEDVNAMYSTGSLQTDYLNGLSNKEKCEKMASISTREPLFWFPKTVNGKVVRCTGMLTSMTSLTCVVAVHTTSWGPYIAYYLVLDFVLRILAGSKLSLVGRLGTLLTLFMKPDPRSGRPKQFASMCKCNCFEAFVEHALAARSNELAVSNERPPHSLTIHPFSFQSNAGGLMFSLLGSVFYLVGLDIVGSVFIAGLAAASGMEGFADYCLGCVFFRIGIQCGIIPK